MSEVRSLRITARAKLDLAEIWAFIAADSEARADAFLEALEHRFEPLRSHPGIGAPRDQLEAGLRAVFHKKYVIYYQATDTEIIIVRVAQGSRDMASLFEPDER